MIEIPPAIHTISQVALPDIERFELSNKIPVLFIPGGHHELTRLDIVVKAGRTHELKKLAAVCCMHMLKEGAGGLSSQALAEAFDDLGASLAFPFSFDAITSSTICLSRYFGRVNELMSTLVRKPSFHQEEFDRLLNRITQKLKIDLSQNEVVAYRKCTEMIFGESHPYGYNSSEELYRDVRVEDLLHHHTSFFTPARTSLILSGRPPSNWQDVLEEQWGHWPQAPSTVVIPSVKKVTRSGQECVLAGKGSQTAIRLGRSMPGSNHPDFAALLLLNTILGGYYGSRLMKNIREEKGLTYGIHSSLDTFELGSLLSISVETDHINTDEVLKCMEQEVVRLQKEPVGQEELEMVRNYLGGYFLSLVDGPFATAEVVRSHWLDSGQPQFLEPLFQKMQIINQRELLRVANRYLSWEDLTKVIIH